MVTSVTLTIPPNAQVNFLKKIGDAVERDETVLEYVQNQEQVEIDIAQNLHVSPKNAAKFLIKNLGDQVGKDEVIAKRQKGFIFKKTIAVKSLLEGKIFELDNFSGKVKIVGHPVKKTLKSVVSGKIKELGATQVVIDFKGEEIKLKRAIGGTFFAPLFVVAEADEEVNSAAIACDYKNAVIVGGHFSATDLNKCLAVGVRGVLAVKLSDNNFDRFAAEKTMVMDKTEAKLSLAVGLVAAHDFEIIKRHAGKQGIYFDGTEGRVVIP